MSFDPASVFGPVSEEYQGLRPGYPDALYDALEDSLDDGLVGVVVLDVGAGTGIASAALSTRGARVVAVEPALPMVGTLHAARPSLPALAGRAEALPVASGSADLITCAQAWHWVDAPLAAAECRRSLRAGGLLARWWNVSVGDADWLGEVQHTLGLPPYGNHEDTDRGLDPADGFRPARRFDFPWSWCGTIDDWVRLQGTRSALAHLGADAGAHLETMAAILRRHCPEGIVTEPFVCRLALDSV